MKLKINGYVVDGLDTLFIALSFFFTVIAVFDLNFSDFCRELLFFILFVNIATLKSEKKHLEEKLSEFDVIKTFPGNIQDAS